MLIAVQQVVVVTNSVNENTLIADTPNIPYHFAYTNS